jgi:ribosomal protein S6
MTFTADAAFPAELDRKMRIDTNVMRSLIICIDE